MRSTYARRVAELENRLRMLKVRRDEQILDLYDSGVPMARIAKDVGLSRQRVYNIVSQHRDTARQPD